MSNSNSSRSFRRPQRLNPGQNQGPPTLRRQHSALGGSRQEVAQPLPVGDWVLTEDLMTEWLKQKIQLEEESAKRARLRRNLVIALGIALSPVVGAVTAMLITAI